MALNKEQKKRHIKKKNLLIIFLLLILLLLIISGFLIVNKFDIHNIIVRRKEAALDTYIRDPLEAAYMADSLKGDSLKTAYIEDSLRKDSIRVYYIADSLVKDSLEAARIADSLAKDSIGTVNIADSLTKDSIRTANITDSLTKKLQKTAHIVDSLTKELLKTAFAAVPLSKELQRTVYIVDSLTKDLRKAAYILDSLTKDLLKTDYTSDPLIKEMIKKANIADSLTKELGRTDYIADSLKTACAADTISPWVYPDPSGGLHYGKVYVRFIATEPCKIEWRLKDKNKWHIYKNDSICITKNSVLSFRAEDNCGNSMDIRSELYEIRAPEKEKLCPDNMEYIEIGETKFCIDRYEWPNKKGVKPCSYISIYHAMDSCFTVDKRLCTTEEWSLACSGPYNWKYTYGDIYEPNACVTRDTTVSRSGKMSECRGYFGVYDMSGNLAEWTNTRSKSSNMFFNVMGGFWESGPQSTCFNPRYSYYPENRHNPVGFRCCKDVNK